MNEGPFCPACGGTGALARLDIGLPEGASLRRCNVCQGVLANREAVAVAREHYDRSHPIMVARVGVHQCRACHLRAEPGARRCNHCLHSLELSCPQCSTTMTVLGVAAATIDACIPCQLVFFDKGEFSRICSNPSALHSAMDRLRREEGPSASSVTADVLQASVDGVELVGHTAQAAHAAGNVALDAASGAARALADADLPVIDAAGSASLEASEAIVEMSSSAAEAVLEVLGGLFDGL